MARREKVLTGVLMSCVMALALSGFFTLTRIGLAPGWVSGWASGFASAWPVALVLSMTVARPVGLVAGRLAALLP